MGWQFVALALCLFAGYWFIAVLLACSIASRWLQSPPESPSTTRKPTSRSPSTPRRSQEITDLLVLRLELGRQLANGTIPQELYRQAVAHIDTLTTETLGQLDIPPDSRRWYSSKEAAWKLLIQRGLLPQSPPPWQSTRHDGEKQLPQQPQQLTLPLPPRSPSQLAQSKAPPATLVTPPAPLHLQPSTPIQPLPAETAALLEKPVSVPPPASPPFTPSPLLSPPSQTEDRPRPRESSGWKPTTPTALERALQAVSGWPALLVPFLVQNSLWFIGMFCIVAAATLLVSYTTGFTKAVSVSTSLSAGTLFLLWQGYRLRQRYPEMEVASRVFLILGVLLIPLDIATAVRLIATGQSLLWIVIGSVVTTASLVGLFYATILVSGVMDRALQGQHPHVFLALVATQLVVPLLTFFPSLPLLAVAHCVVLGLLAYGLARFVHGWLHTLFVEQRKGAYYAAGTLVYAALVSFFHLTWGYTSSLPLPVSYYGPFLMTLCGLLFYVDAQFKHWSKQYAFLSHFSFLVYGLSVLALLVSSSAPTTRLLTLGLGMGVYSLVVWQYLTLPPLYLLLGCVGWLYHLLLLQYVPDQWYLLASLPGIVTLFFASHWMQRRSTLVALIGYRVWLVAALLLTAWSLAHAQPSLVAMSTALVMMGLAFSGLRFAPAQLFGGPEKPKAATLANSPWLYSVTLMGAVAVTYVPPWGGLTWGTQCAFGLTLLAVGWNVSAFHLRRIATASGASTVEVLLNSALLNLSFAFLLAVTLTLPGLTHSRPLPFLLSLMGGVLLWMSLTLRTRELLYVVLGLWGMAGAIFKLTYFPGYATGTVELGLSLVVWVVVWRLEHAPEEIKTLRHEQTLLRAQQQPPLTLLWSFSVSGAHTYEELLRVPLLQAMVVLWAIGMTHIGRQLLHGSLSWGGTLAATLGALGTLIGSGYFRLSLLLPLAMLLGLGTCLSATSHLGASTLAEQSLIAAMYALLAWRGSLFALAHPQLPRIARFLHLGGNRRIAEGAIHWTAFVITLLGITMSIGWYGVFTPSAPLLCTVLTGMVFLWLAGHRYQRLRHSYDFLALVVLSALLGYTWTFAPQRTVLGLLRDSQLGVLTVVLSLSFWIMADTLSRWATRDTEAPVALTYKLYTGPLSNVAVVLAVFAAVQQLALVWSDAVQAITPLSIGVVFVASVALLLANRLVRQPAITFISVLLTVLAVLWAEAFAVHPGIAFSLWPGRPTFIDAWLTLSLLALGLAVLAHRVRDNQQWQHVYGQPLFVAASLVYGWALLGTIAFFVPTPFRPDALLPLTFVALALVLFPLLRSLPTASVIRGLTLPLFGSAFLVSVLALTGLSQWINFTSLLWGYTLWNMGNFALSRWNTPWPQWAVAPEAWPWCGLVTVSFSMLSHVLDGNSRVWLHTLEHAGFCAAGALYLFLMLRNSAWVGFPWCATLLLTWAGVNFNEAWLWHLPVESYSAYSLFMVPPFGYAIGNLTWANILLRAVPVWRQYGDTLSARWHWQTPNIVTPFLVWPALLLFSWALHLFVVVISSRHILSMSTAISTWLPYCLLEGVLTLSFLHLWWLHRARWETHVVFASLFCALLAAWRGSATQLFHFPLFLAFWSASVFLAHLVWEKHQRGTEQLQPLRHALSLWVAPSLAVAIATTLAHPELLLAERLVTLAVLISVATSLGWQRQQSLWLLTAGLLLLVFVHIWPLLLVSSSQMELLLPWYALQLAALAWVAVWSSDTLHQRIMAEDSPDENRLTHNARLRLVASLLSHIWPLIALLSVLEWGWHSLFLVGSLMATGHPQWLISSGDMCVSLSAVALLLALGVRQARQSQQPEWVYATAILGGAVGVYMRLLLVGLAPVSVWDTAALMTATYLLFALQRFTASAPLLHVVMAMPLFTLLTIPLQTASLHASVTFITAGTLYLLTHRETDRPLPLYLALVALNAAIYVWVPMWANQLHVLQLWVAPASLSVLFMLHFHRHELKPNVLSNARLAATCVLYVSATGDVFLQDNLALFALILVLSVAGILLGVALRTKAFLYGGTSFLVFNIMGQLFIHVPEHALGRAILLFVAGVAILGGKFWFDLQREEFLQRIRIFRADLETWA